MNLDLNALRLWGIAASAASMAVALAFAWRAPAPASAQPRLDLVQAQSANVAFIVRFRGDGPIARAQALAARGDEARAARQVETQLRRQPGLSGLCLDRFTIGGAETVLRSCEPVPASARQAYAARWLARLDAMRAVDYVDANVEASPQAAPD